MIFCSKRVFLNILTQMMDLPTLLNANYFIIDQSKTTAGFDFAAGIPWEEPKLDENGQWVYEPTHEPSLDFGIGEPRSGYGTSKYFVHYDGTLNPTPYVAVVSNGIKNDFTSPEERFAHYLMKTDTQLSVYQYLFQNKLQGNGLQILIMRDDDNCLRFGDMICSYLSQMFGADITYADPKYRPAKGKIQYAGDKQFAFTHIQELRDAQLLTSFEMMVSQARFGAGYENIMQFLNAMDMPKLVYLYNKLFPADPLPPGNYTTEHVKRIICGRVCDSIGADSRPQTFDNLYSFDALVNDYSPEETFDGIE